MPRSNTFTLPVPARFNLSQAICSYGYFLLAPSQWEPATKRYRTNLRGRRDRVIEVTVAQPKKHGPLRITCVPAIDRAERPKIIAQLGRTLRLDEPAEVFARWHKLHPVARRAGFARMFRSPTLFEDIVKTMTGCNVTWRNTMSMNRLMCEHVGGGAFPTPKQLAAVKPSWLKQHCKVGYRAERIIRLARDVVAGRLDLAPFEDRTRSTEEIFEMLLAIYGVGEYAAGNLCQLVGRYDRLAIDTETYRHFEQKHNLPRGKNPKLIHPKIEAHYAPYAPFQFLAYWFELWCGYEERSAAPAVEWTAEKQGETFTASVLKKPAPE